MKSVAIVLCLAAVAFAGVAEDWSAYVAKYNLQYSADEYAFRQGVYEANLVRAARLQLENPLAVMGETIFSHLTQEEFESTYLKTDISFKKFDLPPTNFSDYAHLPSYGADPTNWDWSQAGGVSPVKNQGQCGSCWAFSAVETIESYWYLAGKPKDQLSVEQVVDCDKSDNGCQGGWPANAYKYVQQAGGLDGESSYPYHAGNGQSGSCAFNSGNIKARISGWSQLNGEAGIYQQLSRYGPASIVVDASSWNAYKSGTLTSCGTSIDHGVQVTGYSNYPNGYWNVRNSWGEGWGMSGYIHLAINRDMCAINTAPTVVSI